VGLARALAAGQDILLMDEPFGSLDPVTRAEMQDLLRRLTRQPSRPRTTVLLVTHDLEEALFLAEGDSDRIVLLDEGRVAADTAGRDFLSCGVAAVDAYVSAARRGSRGRAGGMLEERR
jgi:osmoprotectant transport system ATP-binding protein